jgi:hypothetical protein
VDQYVIYPKTHVLWKLVMDKKDKVDFVLSMGITIVLLLIILALSGCDLPEYKGNCHPNWVAGYEQNIEAYEMCVEMESCIVDTSETHFYLSQKRNLEVCKN